MPIDYKKYPTNWKEFSKYIRFDRAGNICEKCGVRNHSIGYRLDGEFELWELEDEQTMNDTKTIRGENGYKASKEMLEWILATEDVDGDDIPRPFIIMLTVAHLDRIDDICRCEEKTGNKCAIESHVLALCQSCHLRYDTERHKFNARRTRAERMRQPWLADWDKRYSND